MFKSDWTPILISRPEWDKQRVWNVVGKVITAEDYKTITGEEYL